MTHPTQQKDDGGLSSHQSTALELMRQHGGGWFAMEHLFRLCLLTLEEQHDLDYRGMIETDIEFLDETGCLRFRLSDDAARLPQEGEAND